MRNRTLRVRRADGVRGNCAGNARHVRMRPLPRLKPQANYRTRRGSRYPTKVGAPTLCSGADVAAAVLIVCLRVACCGPRRLEWTVTGDGPGPIWNRSADSATFSLACLAAGCCPSRSRLTPWMASRSNTPEASGAFRTACRRTSSRPLPKHRTDISGSAPRVAWSASTAHTSCSCSFPPFPPPW